MTNNWNTWNTRSVLSHVLLPEGFSVNIGFYDHNSAQHLRQAIIARPEQQEARVIPGAHAYDGSYTSCIVEWQNQRIQIESGHDGDDLLILVTRLATATPVDVILDCAVLWNSAGQIREVDEAIEGFFGKKTISVFATIPHAGYRFVDVSGPYKTLPLDGSIGICTGAMRTADAIRMLLDKCKKAHENAFEMYGTHKPAHTAMQSCLAWDTIYDPEHQRIITPVSRQWNNSWWNGWVLFCWDTYFAAYMLSFDNQKLAEANVLAITSEVKDLGFVPNYTSGGNVKSRDRAQPPVGSFVVREIYRRYNNKEFISQVFDDLLTWNRWWNTHRNFDGFLCWGSNFFEPRHRTFESSGVHELFGAALESGLDNSPMYDGVPFDKEKSLMLLADAGLMGLYVYDCECLADLAAAIGNVGAEKELIERSERFRNKLRTLWDEETGIFCNKRLDTGAFEHRLSPTNFYPLMARAATQQQAERMMHEHYFNPDEFHGEWVMPSITRNDPAFGEQDYWRGRIWAPMNVLVYLGMLRYDLPEARKDLAAKSKALLLKEWNEKGHVHENYCANTGVGCNSKHSDAFYHWGALLGVIAMIEDGYVSRPTGSE